MLGNDLRIEWRRLILRDRTAQTDFENFCERLKSTSDIAEMPTQPIVIRRKEKPPIIMRILPIDGAARGPFLSARALVILIDMATKLRPKTEEIARIFRLTTAEARIAARVATGMTLENAAVELGITKETARNQLKSVFAKTGTHRQSELVALLARL
ncbi:hypothetical protein MHY1_p00017 (plasmid) [Methylovirgula sp. HY1]|nr:hypothetical protein MHY1_p00017 [Methylovirgula sp. HY1]